MIGIYEKLITHWTLNRHYGGLILLLICLYGKAYSRVFAVHGTIEYVEQDRNLVRVMINTAKDHHGYTDAYQISFASSALAQQFVKELVNNGNY